MKEGADLLVLYSIFIIVFTALVHVVPSNPKTIALIGLALILAKICLQVDGQYMFTTLSHETPQENKKDYLSEDKRWPNVTHAEVEKTMEVDVTYAS